MLPPLVGGQAESWAALVELAPQRQATDLRPTDDIDVVVDIRTEPAGLARIHSELISASFDQDSPGPEGTAHRYRRGVERSRQCSRRLQADGSSRDDRWLSGRVCRVGGSWRFRRVAGGLLLVWCPGGPGFNGVFGSEII